MHALAGCPSEPEETYGDEQRADDGDGHAFLWLELTLVVILGFLYVIQVREEGGHDDERADEEAEERQAEELLAPVVDTEKDNGEGLEPDVEEGVDEADVDVEREHDRLLKVERKGAHEDVDGKVARGHGSRGNLGGGHDRGVARGLAQTARAAVEDVRCGGLGEEEEEQDERRAREPHQLPDRPAPALEARREAPEQRAQARRRRGEDSPDRHPVRALLGGVQVRDGRAARGEDRRAEESREEAEGHQHAVVGRQRGRDLQ